MNHLLPPGYQLPYVHNKRESRRSQHTPFVSQRRHFFLLLDVLVACEAPAQGASPAAWTASAFTLLEVLLLGTAVDGPPSSFSSTSSALTPLRLFLEERLADGARSSSGSFASSAPPSASPSCRGHSAPQPGQALEACIRRWISKTEMASTSTRVTVPTWQN
jgi:hypothetical protein